MNEQKDEGPRAHRRSNLTASEALRFVREHPEADHSLRVLDIIDTKVTSIFTFIGVIIAAVLIFIANDIQYADVVIGDIVLSQRLLVLASLIMLLVAAAYALTCVYIIDIGKIVRRCGTAEGVVAELNRITASRRRRYLRSLYFTAIGTLTGAVAIGISL